MNIAQVPSMESTIGCLIILLIVIVWAYRDKIRGRK